MADNVRWCVQPVLKLVKGGVPCGVPNAERMRRICTLGAEFNCIYRFIVVSCLLNFYDCSVTRLGASRLLFMLHIVYLKTSEKS